MAQTFDREKTRQIRNRQATGLAFAVACGKTIYDSGNKERKRNSSQVVVSCAFSALPLAYAVVRPQLPVADTALVNEIVSDINAGRLKKIELEQALSSKEYSASIKSSILKAKRKLEGK